MAVRRMIHQDVICCDDFLDMSFEAQALFFQLQIKADEYGFVQSPRSTLRMMGASNDSLEALIHSGFVIRFHSGVIVMTHWNKANTRRADREAKMRFPDEYNQLHIDEETGLYSMRDGNGIPSSSQREPTVIPSISNSPSNSLSVNQEEAEAEATTSSSTSSSEEPRARTREDRDEDADVLLRFLYAHKIKIARPDVSKLFDDGFDLDTIFWIIEKTERAEPRNLTSYFNSVCEDKLDHRATTIDLIRDAECDSNTDYEIFDRHLAYWRKEYQSFKGEDDRP